MPAVLKQILHLQFMTKILYSSDIDLIKTDSFICFMSFLVFFVMFNVLIATCNISIALYCRISASLWKRQ